MKIRRSIAAAGATVVLSATGALALPAVASAHNASTTLKFTAVTNKSHSFARTIFINQETDVSSAGKTIGFDVVYVKVTGGPRPRRTRRSTSRAACCTPRPSPPTAARHSPAR